MFCGKIFQWNHISAHIIENPGKGWGDYIFDNISSVLISEEKNGKKHTILRCIAFYKDVFWKYL